MSKIMNQAFLDLRNFSPEALKKIRSITNVASIALPENPTPEFSEAYASIKKTNVASEFIIPDNACVFNGMTNLTKEDVVKDSTIVCNGSLVVRDIPKEMNIRLIVNGSLIKTRNVFAEIIKINGTVLEIDDDVKLIMALQELIIDKNFINNLTEKTAIINCGKVYIDNEITDTDLRSKGIVFYNIGKLTAKKELHGYIQANSNYVGVLLTPKADNKKERKFRKLKLWWK